MGNPRLQLDIVGADKTGQAFRSVRSEIDRTSSSMRRFARGFGIGLVGSAAISRFVGSIGSVNEALAEFDALAKQIRTSGIDSDFYQGLQQSAEEASVSQELLNSSAIAFVKRMGELRAGTGPLVTGLKGVDKALLRSLESSRDQTDAWRILSDAIKNARTVQDEARIANAAFGRSGVAVTRVLKDGADSIDQMAEKARALGILIERDLLDNAERLQNDFGVASRVLDLKFKKALIDVSPTIIATGNALVFSLKRGQEWVNFFGRLSDRITGDTPRLRKALDELSEEFQSLFPTPKGDRLDITRKVQDDLLKDPPRPRLNPFRDETAAGRAAFKESSIAIRQASEETDKLGRKLDDVRDAGTVAFEEVGQAAERLFGDLRLTGNSVLDQLIGKFASLGLQEFFSPGPKSISGGGGVASNGFRAPFSITDIFSFGGFRASGGRVSPGRAFMVGERGREVFVPDQPGQIFPNDALSGMSISVNVIDNAGVDVSASTESGLDGQQIINLVVNSRQFGTAVDRQINRGTSAGLRR